MAEKKYVYPFEEAYGLGKELLGGKGAGLAEMSHIGVPVPEGFTITTEGWQKEPIISFRPFWC